MPDPDGFGLAANLIESGFLFSGPMVHSAGIPSMLSVFGYLFV
jgi:hypothetical protein